MQYNKQDQEAVTQAQLVLEFSQGKLYQEVIKPLLLQFSSEGYPNPKDFKNYEEMLPIYTFALGGTDAIKKVVDFFEGQEEVLKSIQQKYENRKAYKMEE